MDLVNFVLAIKKRISRYHFEQYTTVPPYIHLMVIVAISHETFRGSIPSRGDILCVWMFAVNTFARPKVSKFYLIARNKYILWLDVPMKNSFLVSKRYRLKNSIHVIFDLHWIQVTIINQALIQILFHQFEHKGQLASRLIIEYFD